MNAKKDYVVLVDMIWSKEYKVKASNTSEAKEKVWQKFKNRPTKHLFRIDAQRIKP